MSITKTRLLKESVSDGQHILNTLKERKGNNTLTQNSFEFTQNGYDLSAMAEDLAEVVARTVGGFKAVREQLGRPLTADEREEVGERIRADVKFRKAENVASEWTDKSLGKITHKTGIGSFDKSIDINKWKRTLKSMTGNPGLETLMTFCKGDINTATAALMSAASSMTNRFGTQALSSNWAFDHLLQGLEAFGDNQNPDDDSWFDPGSMSMDAICAGLEIMPLVEQLRLVYEPFADRKVYARREVEVEADDVTVTPLRSFMGNDLRRIMPMEMLADDDTFSYRVATKQIRQTIPQEVYLKKQKGANVKMMIDVSGSMTSNLKTTDGHFWSAWQYAIASAIALLDRGILNGSSKVRIGLFDTRVVEIKETEPNKVINALLTDVNFTGGGTNIDTALKWADEIVDEELNDEIILITDGGDTVQYKPKQKLTTYFCAARGSNPKLEELSDKYECVTDE